MESSIPRRSRTSFRMCERFSRDAYTLAACSLIAQTELLMWCSTKLCNLRSSSPVRDVIFSPISSRAGKTFSVAVGASVSFEFSLRLAGVRRPDNSWINPGYFENGSLIAGSEPVMPPNPRGPVPGVIRHILVIKARKSINPQLRMAQLDKLSAVDLKIKKYPRKLTLTSLSIQRILSGRT